MAAAWLLVALTEFTAARVERSPVSYLLPQAVVDEEEEPEAVFGPRPEERTVVAPPDRISEPDEEPSPRMDEDVDVPGFEEAPEAVEERAAEPEPEPEPLALDRLADWGEAPAAPAPLEAEDAQPEPPRPRRLRSLLRRRQPVMEPVPTSPPRHVKLLPRRPVEEPSRASEEVAELFG